MDADTTVSTMFSGTPAAVPLRPAKLARMSPRTTPLWLSTVGPFEPSAGYGPAVSSGMRLHVLDVGGVVVVVGVLSVVVVAPGTIALRKGRWVCSHNWPPGRQ